MAYHSDFIAARDLNVRCRVDLDDGRDFVVYDDGHFTHAVSASSWMAHDDEPYSNTDGNGYTAWCQDTDCVDDEATARAIIAAAQDQCAPYGVKVIHLGGTCRSVTGD